MDKKRIEGIIGMTPELLVCSLYPLPSCPVSLQMTPVLFFYRFHLHKQRLHTLLLVLGVQNCYVYGTLHA